MASLLQRAIDLAVSAHRDGEDPPGEPYIVHPMRVLLAVSQRDDDDQDELLRCVAILHDTLERGGLTAADLKKAGMPPNVVRAVELLTHHDDQSYADYVIAIKPNRLAMRVKLADLLDNANLRHVPFRGDKLKKDVPRLVRYAASYKYLTGQMSKRAYLRAMKRGE